jgi:Oxidoreductase family, NAD-binding Rossmann fold
LLNTANGKEISLLYFKKMKRRNFLQTGTAAAAALFGTPALAVSPLPETKFSDNTNAKKKLAIVGTGHRGTGFWGKPVKDNFGDMVEFVGLCDINPGRLETAKQFMGLNCPTFSDFDKMLKETKPDMVIVTTVDCTHDIFIIKALEAGCDVITEKPTNAKAYWMLKSARVEKSLSVSITATVRT